MPTKAQLQAELEETKRRLQELTPPPWERQEAEELEDEDQDQDRGGPSLEEVDLFLEEAGTPGGELLVDGYRYDDEGDGKIKYVHRWALPEFSLQVVKDTYGGGRWNFRLKRGPGGKLVKSRTLVIEGKARTPDMAPAQPDPRTFVDRILDQQGLILEKLQEVRQGPPPGLQATDPINMAMSIVAAFQSVLSPMQEALLKKEKTGPNFGELVQIFSQGVELGKMSAPSAPDPMASVLASTLPGLMGAITGGGNRPLPSPVDILTNPPQSEPMAEPSPQRHRPAWDLMLAPWLPQILKWARNDVDPVLRAEFVVDEIPEAAEHVLVEQLNRGKQFFGEFMMLHPEAKPWEAWLLRFWTAVSDQYPWGESGDMNFPDNPFRDSLTPPPETELQELLNSGPEVGTS